MSSALFIYITCENKKEARSIAQALVKKRLVACANILDSHESVYWWEGKVQDAKEVVVIFKTRTELFEQVEATIRQLHSYDCPCIVALPIEKGHEPYLKWIKAETTK